MITYNKLTWKLIKNCSIFIFNYQKFEQKVKKYNYLHNYLNVHWPKNKWIKNQNWIHYGIWMKLILFLTKMGQINTKSSGSFIISIYYIIASHIYRVTVVFSLIYTWSWVLFNDNHYHLIENDFNSVNQA